MSEPAASHPQPLTEADNHTALFVQLVMQSTSMALMLMGRAPNPMTGQTEVDLDGARLFIGQLEMLEVKTRGNLGAEEQDLLRQSLMHARMSFVEAVGATKPANKPDAEPGVPAAEPDEGVKKRFTKTYGES